MSKLEELIQEYCPDGVAQYSLGELGKFYGGLTGKSKSDFTDGNAIFISYKNVYSNPSLDIHPEDRVKIAENEKQRTLEYGDVVFTGSSETPDECGFSSVVTEKPTEKLYLNSFCFFYRLNDLSIINPHFAKHLFRSGNLRYQIGKTASGVTRFNVSKDKMAKVTIPVPPLPVQEEIVRILDSFTQLTAELQAELQARKKQYEYYRTCLLEPTEDTPIVKLGDFATVARGGNFQKKHFKDTGFPCIHYGQMYTHFGVSTTTVLKYLDEGEFEKSKKAVTNDIVMAVTSENVEDVCSCTAWLGDDEIAVSGHTAIIHHKQNAKYLSYYFRTEHFYQQKAKLAHGTKVIEVTPSKLLDCVIPLPSIAEQNRIVAILDRFDALCNNISAGLPAEIEARQKQYEYYRDKLLTFKKLS